MRLRADSAHIAGWKRAHRLNGCPNKDDGRDECVCSSQKPEYALIPEAEEGDVWASRTQSGTLIGYGLTCPAQNCMQGMHFWTHTIDCKLPLDHGPDWSWTGSPEAGDLSASPSLMIVTEINGQPIDSCGWHGFLTNGQMRSV